jgi:hypothetical protein
VDRAAGFEPVGRGFESLRARQKQDGLRVDNFTGVSFDSHFDSHEILRQ